MLRTFSAFILLAAFFMSGCSTVSDAQNSRGKGTSKIYAKSFDPVWQAAKEVVTNSGLQLVSEDKPKGEIVAQGSVTAFSWGENVALFVAPDNSQSATKVEVVSKRVLATNVTAKNWEPVLLEAIDQHLAGNISEKPKSKKALFQETIPVCEGEKDCLAKWEAAQLWIVHNAGYKLQITTSVLLETFNATGSTTKLAVQVTKEPMGGGKHKILVKTWCDNFIGCTPNAEDAALDFNQKVGAAIP